LGLGELAKKLLEPEKKHSLEEVEEVDLKRLGAEKKHSLEEVEEVEDGMELTMMLKHLELPQAENILVAMARELEIYRALIEVYKDGARLGMPYVFHSYAFLLLWLLVPQEEA